MEYQESDYEYFFGFRNSMLLKSLERMFRRYIDRGQEVMGFYFISLCFSQEQLLYEGDGSICDKEY